MEIQWKRTDLSGKLKGNGKFHFPLRKLVGKCPFPQNFQHKEHGQISPFFRVNGKSMVQIDKNT